MSDLSSTQQWRFFLYQSTFNFLAVLRRLIRTGDLQHLASYRYVIMCQKIYFPFVFIISSVYLTAEICIKILTSQIHPTPVFCISTHQDQFLLHLLLLKSPLDSASTKNFGCTLINKISVKKCPQETKTETALWLLKQS